MNPLDTIVILINGNRVAIGEELPAIIQSFSLSTMGFQINIPSSQSPQVKQWLNTIIDSLDCDYVEYNGILIPSSELRKF